MGQDGLQSSQLFRQENEQSNLIIVSSVPWAGWEPKYDSGSIFLSSYSFFLCYSRKTRQDIRILKDGECQDT